MRTSTASPLTRIIAVLVLMALTCGLPKFFVVCTPEGGTAHVEFACGASCHHGDGDHFVTRDGADDDVEAGGAATPRATTDTGGCVHESLGVELTPAPSKAAKAKDSAPACGIAPLPIETVIPRTHRKTSGYATGPPRPGRTISVLRTTELQE